VDSGQSRYKLSLEGKKAAGNQGAEKEGRPWSSEEERSAFDPIEGRRAKGGGNEDAWGGNHRCFLRKEFVEEGGENTEKWGARTRA